MAGSVASLIAKISCAVFFRLAVSRIAARITVAVVHDFNPNTLWMFGLGFLTAGFVGAWLAWKVLSRFWPNSGGQRVDTFENGGDLLGRLVGFEPTTFRTTI